MAAMSFRYQQPEYERRQSLTSFIISSPPPRFTLLFAVPFRPRAPRALSHAAARMQFVDVPLGRSEERFTDTQEERRDATARQACASHHNAFMPER